MSLLSINGVSVKTPVSFKADVEQIDGETTRNAAGKLKRDRIRKDVWKLSIEWSYLSNAEISIILQAIDGVFFSVTFPNPKTGGLTTRTFYSGTPSVGAYSWSPKFSANMWESLSVNLIEQ